MAYEPTHYHSSKGLARIEDMNPSHLRASAAKMERDGPKPNPSTGETLGDQDHADAIAHMRSVADRKEAEFEANYLAEHGTPYVRKADRT